MAPRTNRSRQPPGSPRRAVLDGEKGVASGGPLPRNSQGAGASAPQNASTRSQTLETPGNPIKQRSKNQSSRNFKAVQSSSKTVQKISKTFKKFQKISPGSRAWATRRDGGPIAATSLAASFGFVPSLPPPGPFERPGSGAGSGVARPLSFARKRLKSLEAAEMRIFGSFQEFSPAFERRRREGVADRCSENRGPAPVRGARAAPPPLPRRSPASRRKEASYLPSRAESRSTALSTAFSEAITMLGSMPTPWTGAPAESASST